MGSSPVLVVENRVFGKKVIGKKVIPDPAMLYLINQFVRSPYVQESHMVDTPRLFPALLILKGEWKSGRVEK